MNWGYFNCWWWLTSKSLPSRWSSVTTRSVSLTVKRNFPDTAKSLIGSAMFVSPSSFPCFQTTIWKRPKLDESTKILILWHGYLHCQGCLQSKGYRPRRRVSSIQSFRLWRLFSVPWACSGRRSWWYPHWSMSRGSRRCQQGRKPSMDALGLRLSSPYQYSTPKEEEESLRKAYSCYTDSMELLRYFLVCAIKKDYLYFIYLYFSIIATSVHFSFMVKDDSDVHRMLVAITGFVANVKMWVVGHFLGKR